MFIKSLALFLFASSHAFGREDPLVTNEQFPDDLFFDHGLEGSLYEEFMNYPTKGLVGEKKTTTDKTKTFQGDEYHKHRQLTIDKDVASGGAALWTGRAPNGKLLVPYRLVKAAFSQKQAAVIFEGMKLVEESGVITFAERTTEDNFIEFDNIDGYGCFSTDVGVALEEYNLINIGAQQSCFSPGTVAHEILHGLGMVHEMSRSDRDDYVVINTDNIRPHQVWQFEKTPTNSLGSPYDYGSIMHYKAKAGALNKTKPTIETLQEFPPGVLTIGQRGRLSYEDKQRLRYLYQCSSGPRTAAEFEAAPCTPDCPCWDGAMGLCNTNADCQGDLFCSWDPVQPPTGCTDGLLYDEQTGVSRPCEDSTWTCQSAIASDICRNYCSLPCPFEPVQNLPARMCLPPPIDCVFGKYDGQTRQCICDGDSVYDPGYCPNDTDGACTLFKQFDATTRQYHCGDQPDAPKECSSDSDCSYLDLGNWEGICVDKNKEDSDEKECMLKPDCIHGTWNRVTNQCDCIGTKGANGYCPDEEGLCTVARQYNPSTRQFYCNGDDGNDAAENDQVPSSPIGSGNSGCTSDGDCEGHNEVCFDQDDDGTNECATKPNCVHGVWDSNLKECECIGSALGVNGFCKESDSSSAACTIAKTFDFKAWKYYCPGEKRRQLRGESSLSTTN